MIKTLDTYYEISYNDDSDYDEYVHAYFYISELLQEDFYSIFDGETAVFSYSCEVNNQIYTKQLGLLIGDINITNISIILIYFIINFINEIIS